MVRYDVSYRPKEIVTTTSGAGGPGGSVMALAEEIIRAKLDKLRRGDQLTQMQIAQMSRPSNPKGASGPTPGATHGGLGGDGTPSPDKLRQQAQMLELRDKRNRIAAMESQTPTRLMTGSQVISGPVADTSHLTGYGREVFLPQNSSFGRSPDDEVNAQVRGARDLRFQSEFGIPATMR